MDDLQRKPMKEFNGRVFFPFAFLTATVAFLDLAMAP